MRYTSPGATATERLSRRLRPGRLLVKMCRLLAWCRMILPVPVRRNRFLTPLCVFNFCFAMMLSITPTQPWDAISPTLPRRCRDSALVPWNACPWHPPRDARSPGPLLRRNHHHQEASFKPWRLLDLAGLADQRDHLFHYCTAHLLIRHLAPAKRHSDFRLISIR
jgi:hypothetical protein